MDTDVQGDNGVSEPMRGVSVLPLGTEGKFCSVYCAECKWLSVPLQSFQAGEDLKLYHETSCHGMEGKDAA